MPLALAGPSGLLPAPRPVLLSALGSSECPAMALHRCRGALTCGALTCGALTCEALTCEALTCEALTCEALICGKRRRRGADNMG